MRKALIPVVLASPLLLLVFHVPTVDIPAVFAQTPDGEHNCPSPTAIPPYIGTGTSLSQSEAPRAVRGVQSPPAKSSACSRRLRKVYTIVHRRLRFPRTYVRGNRS